MQPRTLSSQRILRLGKVLLAVAGGVYFALPYHAARSMPVSMRTAPLRQMDSEGDDVGVEHTTVIVKNLKYVYTLSIKTIDDHGHQFWPRGVAVDSDGNIYVTGSRLGVEVYDKTGQHLQAIGFDTGQAGGTAHPEQGQLLMPMGVAVAGDSVYVTDGSWLQFFHTSGDYLGGVDLSDPDDPNSTSLVGVAASSDGTVYVVDSHKQSIISLTSGGQRENAWGAKGTDDGQFTHARFIAVNAGGDVIVNDDQACNIQVFGSDGTFKLRFGKKGNDVDQLSQPQGLAIDSLGDIFVCTGTTVKAYSKAGEYLGALHTPPGANAPILGEAMGIALDSKDNLYIANSNNKSIDVYTRQH